MSEPLTEKRQTLAAVLRETRRRLDTAIVRTISPEVGTPTIRQHLNGVRDVFEDAVSMAKELDK